MQRTIVDFIGLEFVIGLLCVLIIAELHKRMPFVLTCGFVYANSDSLDGTHFAEKVSNVFLFKTIRNVPNKKTT